MPRPSPNLRQEPPRPKQLSQALEASPPTNLPSLLQQLRPPCPCCYLSHPGGLMATAPNKSSFFTSAAASSLPMLLSVSSWRFDGNGSQQIFLLYFSSCVLLA